MERTGAPLPTAGSGVPGVNSAQVDKSQTHAKSAKKNVKIATKSCQKMIDSKFTKQ